MSLFEGLIVGQYVPVDSLLHRRSAAGKIVASGAFVAACLAARDPLSFSLCALFLLAAVRLAGLTPLFLLRGLRALLLLFALTFALHLFLTEGREIWRWGWLAVTEEGLYGGSRMLARLVLLVAGTTLLTLTTAPVDLADGLERVLSPLARLRFPVQEFALMLTIALRFVPILVEEADKIGAAQRARGASFSGGGLAERARRFLPILVPLFVISFRRADELALAMESRCYRGGEGRTRYAEERFGPADAFAVALAALFAASLVIARLRG